MSFMLLGILNSQAAGGVAYWITSLGDTQGDVLYALATDNETNVYSIGESKSAGAGSDDYIIVKYDAAGAVLWSRSLGGLAADTGNAITIDSSNNVIVNGDSRSPSLSNKKLLIAKYNSSGTIQWQRDLGGASDENMGLGVSSDSAGNIYVAGSSRTTSSGSADFLLAKYNSGGTLQWQRVLGGASDDTAYAVTVDSSDNIYLGGYTESSGAGGRDILLAKYNSGGTIQWQRVLGGSTTDLASGLVTDSSDNIYLAGLHIDGTDRIAVAKYNSGGTLQWQRTLDGAGAEQGRAIAIDTDNNIYLTGNTSSDGAGSNDFIIAKYNSGGTIQWQRTLGTTGSEVGRGIAIGSDGSLFVGGYVSTIGTGGAEFLVAKLPNDGSLTGTYVLGGVNIVYEAATLTDAAGALTGATPSLTDQAGGLTGATPTNTDASVSFTQYITEL